MIAEESHDFSRGSMSIKRFRRNPIKVQEFVFPIHGNGQYISSEDIKYIIERLFVVQQGGIYKDRTGKCEFFQRISKSPEDSGSTTQQHQTNENKQTTKINKIMKKNTIKLNESQLRDIIKESINEALINEYNGYGEQQNATNVPNNQLLAMFVQESEQLRRSLGQFQDTARQISQESMRLENTVGFIRKFGQQFMNYCGNFLSKLQPQQQR